jgi:hypothetical protein
VFTVCLLCHGEIVRTRPAPKYLTSFYLAISAGGALGGIFATLVAPRLFTTYIEWDAALFIACLASLAAIGHAGFARLMRNTGSDSNAAASRRDYGRIGVQVFALLSVATILVIDLTEFLGSRNKNVQWADRNFFGTLKIQQRGSDNAEQRRNVLVHGTTTHGTQFTLASRRREPTTYYGHQTGIGRAIDYFHEHLPSGGVRMAVIGLGAGTLAAYPNAGDSITFYEINPTVIDVAENARWFTYLRDCRDRGARCEVHIGDARLTLKHELESSSAWGAVQLTSATSARLENGLEQQAVTNELKQHPSYHVIALDAFSGDSIPAHLLTVEAFELYLKCLAPAAGRTPASDERGTIAIHITNKYLDLEPIVSTLVQRFGLFSLRFDTSDDPGHDGYHSNWIVITQNAKMAASMREGVIPVKVSNRAVLWTDDRSSLFEVLR